MDLANVSFMLHALRQLDAHWIIIVTAITCFISKDVKAETWLCDRCKHYLSGSYYGCVICGIRLHLRCVPIPKIVEHKCHLHPLELVDSVVEDDYSRVNNCDVCETPRDAKNSFYKCKKCGFVAHIECIVSEVSLQSTHLEESWSSIVKFTWMLKLLCFSCACMWLIIFML